MKNEDELIGRITDLQTLHKTEKFQRSSKQKRGKDEFGFLENLNSFLNFNLAKYTQGKTELPEDTAQRMRIFDHGLIKSRVFSERKEDRDLAASVIDAIFEATVNELETRKHEPFPIELRSPTWLHLLQAIKPSDENRGNPEAFSWADAKEVFLVLQSQVEEHEARSDTFAGELTIVANRMEQSSSKELIDRLIQIPRNDDFLLRVITDAKLLKSVIQQDGAEGVIAFLNAVVHINQCELPCKLSDLFKHLSAHTKSMVELKLIFDELTKMAASSDLNGEFIRLLMETKTTDEMQKLFRVVQMSDGHYLSNDAQTICTTILRKYKMDRTSDQFQAFCNRIGRIGLDKSILDRINTNIGRDPDFAKSLILNRIDVKNALAEYEDSLATVDQYYWLCIIAIQTFRGHELGSVTRGLAVMQLMLRDSKIDDQHYRLLFDDLTRDLPTSLQNLSEYPDDISHQLRTLYLPLLVAADMLHKDEMIAYLSDAYYALKKHDRARR